MSFFVLSPTRPRPAAIVGLTTQNCATTSVTSLKERDVGSLHLPRTEVSIPVPPRRVDQTSQTPSAPKPKIFDSISVSSHDSLLPLDAGSSSIKQPTPLSASSSVVAEAYAARHVMLSKRNNIAPLKLSGRSMSPSRTSTEPSSHASSMNAAKAYTLRHMRVGAGGDKVRGGDGVHNISMSMARRWDQGRYSKISSSGRYVRSAINRVEGRSTANYSSSGNASSQTSPPQDQPKHDYASGHTPGDDASTTRKKRRRFNRLSSPATLSASSTSPLVPTTPLPLLPSTHASVTPLPDFTMLPPPPNPPHSRSPSAGDSSSSRFSLSSDDQHQAEVIVSLPKPEPEPGFGSSSASSPDPEKCAIIKRKRSRTDARNERKRDWRIRERLDAQPTLKRKRDEDERPSSPLAPANATMSTSSLSSLLSPPRPPPTRKTKTSLALPPRLRYRSSSSSAGGSQYLDEDEEGDTDGLQNERARKAPHRRVRSTIIAASDRRGSGRPLGSKNLKKKPQGHMQETPVSATDFRRASVRVVARATAQEGGKASLDMEKSEDGSDHDAPEETEDVRLNPSVRGRTRSSSLLPLYSTSNCAHAEPDNDSSVPSILHQSRTRSSLSGSSTQASPLSHSVNGKDAGFGVWSAQKRRFLLVHYMHEASPSIETRRMLANRTGLQASQVSKFLSRTRSEVKDGLRTSSIKVLLGMGWTPPAKLRGSSGSKSGRKCSLGRISGGQSAVEADDMEEEDGAYEKGDVEEVLIQVPSSASSDESSPVDSRALSAPPNSAVSSGLTTSRDEVDRSIDTDSSCEAAIALVDLANSSGPQDMSSRNRNASVSSESTAGFSTSSSLEATTLASESHLTSSSGVQHSWVRDAPGRQIVGLATPPDDRNAENKVVSQLEFQVDSYVSFYLAFSVQCLRLHRILTLFGSTFQSAPVLLPKPPKTTAFLPFLPHPKLWREFQKKDPSTHYPTSRAQSLPPLIISTKPSTNFHDEAVQEQPHSASSLMFHVPQGSNFRAHDTPSSASLASSGWLHSPSPTTALDDRSPFAPLTASFPSYMPLHRVSLPIENTQNYHVAHPEAPWASSTFPGASERASRAPRETGHSASVGKESAPAPDCFQHIDRVSDTYDASGGNSLSQWSAHFPIQSTGSLWPSRANQIERPTPNGESSFHERQLGAAAHPKVSPYPPFPLPTPTQHVSGEAQMTLRMSPPSNSVYRDTLADLPRVVQFMDYPAPPLPIQHSQLGDIKMPQPTRPFDRHQSLWH